MPASTRFVGIDVSKAHLDVAVRGAPRGGHRFENTRSGIDRLLKFLGKKTSFVVVEATGPYSALVHERLTENGISTAVVNPKRVRDFARSLGKEAKTDAIDASVLAHFGEVARPEATPLPSLVRRELRAVVIRRNQLIDALLRNQSQRETATADFESESFELVEKTLRSAIKSIENRMADLLKHDELRSLTQALVAQKGVATIVASTLLALVPELGSIGHKQLASLIGLAPHANDSGTSQKRRHIRGGRREVRTVMYMAAMVAMRYDENLRTFRERLIAAGKTKKQAIIAVAHKLLVWLNARCRDALNAAAAAAPQTA